MFCIVRGYRSSVKKRKKTECLSQIGNLESMKEERDLTFYEWKSRKDVKKKRDEIYNQEERRWPPTEKYN